jgi:hypothetical protein
MQFHQTHRVSKLHILGIMLTAMIQRIVPNLPLTSTAFILITDITIHVRESHTIFLYSNIVTNIARISLL